MKAQIKNLFALTCLTLAVIGSRATPLGDTVHRYVRSVSAQQSWNLQQSVTDRDLMLVQRQNGDLDVVTTEYATTLPTYSVVLNKLVINDVSPGIVKNYHNPNLTDAWQIQAEGYAVPEGKRLVFSAPCGGVLQAKRMDLTAEVPSDGHLVREAVENNPGHFLYKTWKQVVVDEHGVRVPSCYLEVRKDQTVHVMSGESTTPVSAYMGIPTLNRAHHFKLSTTYNSIDENFTEESETQRHNYTGHLSADWIVGVLPTLVLNMYSWLCN